MVALKVEAKRDDPTGESANVVITDGGRAAAGFSGDAGDCGVRAVSIATGLPYGDVYRALADGMARIGKPRSARDGVPRKVMDDYLASLGWKWVPTMGIGTGCRVHLSADELPGGRIIARLSKHVVAVVNGVVYDDHDPTRDGTRCVYGYWCPS